MLGTADHFPKDDGDRADRAGETDNEGKCECPVQLSMQCNLMEYFIRCQASKCL